MWNFCLGAVACLAQEQSEKCAIRFLPVGEEPPFRQEIRNGVRYQAEAPEGSLPPREISVAGGGDSEKTKLILGRISQAVAAIPGPVSIVGGEVQEGTEVTPWHSFSIAGGRAHLAVLWRDQREGTWAKARHLLLQDDASSFSGGKVRFINAFPAPVAIIFGDEEIGLQPGKVALRELSSRPTSVQAAIQDRKGEWKPMFSTALMQVKSDRTNVVFSFADGEEPRKPLLVTVAREKALTPIPPNNKKN